MLNLFGLVGELLSDHFALLSNVQSDFLDHILCLSCGIRLYLNNIMGQQVCSFYWILYIVLYGEVFWSRLVKDHRCFKVGLALNLTQKKVLWLVPVLAVLLKLERLDFVDLGFQFCDEFVYKFLFAFYDVALTTSLMWGAFELQTNLSIHPHMLDVVWYLGCCKHSL